MFRAPAPVLLLTEDDVIECGKKLAALQELLRKSPYVNNAKFQEAITTLFDFYEDIRLTRYDLRTPERVAEWKEDLEYMAKLENFVINTLVVKAPKKAHVEKQSTEWI